MMQPTQTVAQNVPGSPAATTSGGGFWGGANNFLNTAASIYAQYEAIRAAKNPQMTYVEKAYENPVPTGAAVEVVEGKAQPGTASAAAQDNVNVLGLSVPRVAAYVGGALLVAVIAKKAKLI